MPHDRVILNEIIAPLSPRLSTEFSGSVVEWAYDEIIWSFEMEIEVRKLHSKTEEVDWHEASPTPSLPSQKQTRE